MANPVWPASLPQNPYDPRNNYPQINPQDNIVRTSVDVGPAKQRRRFTAVPSPVTIQIILHVTELDALLTFKKTTLQDALPFDWIDFLDGTTATYRFTGPIQQQFYVDDLWTCTLQLEKLP